MRRRLVATAVVIGAAAAWWIVGVASTPTTAASDAGLADADLPRPAQGPAASASSVRRGAPFSAAGLQDRQAQLQVWQQRLERAQETLASYKQSTRYPFDSRPAAEHQDRWLAHPVVPGDYPLRLPGTATVPGLRVHTTQDRVFATGADTVALTVAASDDDGRPLPLRIVSAVTRAPQDPRGAQPATAAPTVQQPFADDGSLGDQRAGDGVYSARLDPVAEGFGNYAGTIRTELVVQSGEQQGYVAFDVVYSPQVPATWAGPVTETLQDGSLVLVLPVQVAQAGRYVVDGRVDDATGKAFAFLTFNGELPAGAQQITLTVYGKLVRDTKPAFPLALHDVEGFLLKPDAWPDRALMPARDGLVHTTRRYSLAAFSDATFASDETARYLAEYGKDVDQAQQQVDRLLPTQAASAPAAATSPSASPAQAPPERRQVASRP